MSDILHFEEMKMEKNEFFEKIDISFEKHLGIKADVEKKEKLFYFMNKLLEKNEVMNLTAITDPDMVILKHFVDSLEFSKILDENVRNIADVGTGAGFPGLPLAIIYPEIKFLLCDSLQKRIKFLEEVVREIGIRNVDLSHMRAEDVKVGSVYREKFDMAVSRGVSKINTLLEYMLPFVKVGGKVVLYKMADCQDEIENGKKACEVLGGMYENKLDYEILENEPKRCLILYKKVKSVPKNYPRQGNKPLKEPII